MKSKRAMKKLFPSAGVQTNDPSWEYFPHDNMRYLAPQAENISLEDFRNSLLSSDTFTEGTSGRQEYIASQIPRLHRFFSNLYLLKDTLIGPTLDVASGWGILYPAFKTFLPELIPYSIAELTGSNMQIDGDEIECCIFECDRDRLSYQDNHFGLVLFVDCIEHLIVDPLWTILEFNRVLKTGGRLVIATPNAAASFRIFKILQGQNPGTENEYKPSAIYQRHNREWTPWEIATVLRSCGFTDIEYSTNVSLMSDVELGLLRKMQQDGLLGKPFHYFGPELFVSAKKQRHITVDSDISIDDRWPAWLYTAHENYRKRPQVFPIVVSDEYN
ncbi:MAG: methyltransferase domain-containing protein [Gammaproteobacteria bacterium]|nr:methyltransferase domain-containing protein [Gammaproteobacteria bacterium]